MRDHRKRQQKGLDAALKRLWPNGGAPANPARPLPHVASPPLERGLAEAPTRPLVDTDPALELRAPRNSCALAAASVVLIGAWLLTAVGASRAREVGDAGGSIPPLENLTVRGAIRIVDDQGNLVAQIGSVPATSGEGRTMALELRSPGGVDGSRETVRLESLASGAALSLKTPDRHSSVTLVSGEAGPYLLMAQGSQQRLIGTESPEVLPAVGTGREEQHALDLLDRRAQALGEGLFAVDLRVAGQRLRGRILNTTSVRHTGVEVELGLAEQRLTLAVPVISPANSTGFAVALPAGLPDAMLRGARVLGVNSTLHYDAHQPGSESALTR
jgi:hypothetical protein